jgi:hypothetical protein
MDAIPPKSTLQNARDAFDNSARSCFVKRRCSRKRADRTAFEESALLVELHPIIACGVKASPRQACGEILSTLQLNNCRSRVIVLIPSWSCTSGREALQGCPGLGPRWKSPGRHQQPSPTPVFLQTEHWFV